MTWMAQRRKDRSITSGFTLYELVAVMVIMAIIAGTVAISVRGHVSNAQLEAFIERLETFDARGRAEARRLNQSIALAFDSSDQRISQLHEDVAYASPKRSYTVPRGVEIAQIKTARQESDRGVLQIAVSPLGQTDTYALRLEASSGRSVWLVVLGASGQCLRFEKENDVEEIFSLQRGTLRNDAR